MLWICEIVHCEFVYVLKGVQETMTLEKDVKRDCEYVLRLEQMLRVVAHMIVFVEDGWDRLQGPLFPPSA